MDDEEVETDDEGIVELHGGYRGGAARMGLFRTSRRGHGPLEKEAAVPVVKASREVCDAVAAAVTKRLASLTPAVRLNPRASAGADARRTRVGRPRGARRLRSPRG